MSTREQRKKYLALACACDRVELALAFKKPSRPLGVVTGLMTNPWLQVAAAALTPMLPGKLRLAALFYRFWQAKRR